MKARLLLIIFIFMISGCQPSPEGSCWIWLDDMDFDEILDPYGPPVRRLTFSLDSMKIGNKQFNRGLGVHAPSCLNINLNGRALQFESSVGIDDIITKYHSPETRRELRNVANYVYDNNDDHYDFTKGGTAVFNVYLDGHLEFTSGRMVLGSPPKEINLNLKGIKKITLEVLPGDDGSFADYADWGGARINFKKVPDHLKIYHHSGRVLLNHAGFLPEGHKTCYRHGYEKAMFTIIEASTNKMVHEGEFQPAGDGLGKYLRGDFSDFRTPGTYFIQSDTLKSELFRIDKDLYAECLEKHFQYIRFQRSGHPTKGWAPGQHLDDGKRQDNSGHMDVSGGWYDANDLRKPAKGNALLLLALATVAEAGTTLISNDTILDEMKWGNKFLFSMQAGEGYLMNYIGFTWEGFRDNRWTDNIPGNSDDRTIITRPADINTQIAFVAAECKLSRLFARSDPAYSNRCMETAKRAFHWLEEEGKIENHEDLGLMVSAACELYKSSGQSTYSLVSDRYVEKLLDLQQGKDEIPGYTFFDLKEDRPKEGGLVLMGLADYIRTYPENPLADRAKEAIKQFADQYYRVLAGTNAFSILPWIISEDSLSGGKRIGNYWYRNFLHVGINRHLANAGAGLVDAAEVLEEPEYARIAQRQLDWIYGANPFNASTVTGIGYHQPALFKTTEGEFKPHTPELTGGVMTGIGGNEEDRINLMPGWWWTTEYWSPTIMSTMLLVSKLSAYQESVDE